MTNNIERRIAHEFKNQEYDFKYEDSKVVNNCIVKLYDNNNIYTFKLTMNYPFQPPVLFYKNNRQINYNSGTIPNKLLNNYIQQYGKCPCCTCLLCPLNWTPGYKLQDIIDEYDVIKDKIVMCQRKRMFKNIQTIPGEIVDHILSFCA